jgi:tetratricopeptide (TPR) repeat protein
MNGGGDRLAETLPITDAPGAPDDSAAPLPSGATIGRFVVIGTLGRGGMGVVLSAYDPILDRRVALKLLRPGAWRGSSESEGRARLQKEAQAMARLAHPNVVAVHDAGTVGEQLFIAMEYVDGQTLRAWLTGKHNWHQVVRMFAAAGAGLQAAHAAGLVHRDFKPENVLIGKDGRPRVVDFGLVSGVRANLTVEEDSSDEAAPAPDADADLLADPLLTPRSPGVTRHGAVLGTPGYMSPEQLRGEPSDAKADQFSFCVALYEALNGAPPFPEPEYRQALLEGRVASLPKLAPRWLGEVVLRGLRAAPDERWPDMGALLAALARDPAQPRRRALIAGGIILATAALVAEARSLREQRGAACSAQVARARLREVWDPPRRLAAERAFAATGLPYAADSFARVAAALDRYTAAWVTMHEEACRATRVEGRQSDSLLDLRMACLERRRATLAALTGEWAHGVDAQALENAITAAASLPPLDECADARALGERVPPPRAAATRARIDATHADLDRARALRDARRLQEARAAAEAAHKSAGAEGYAPLTAEAAFLLGSLEHAFGEPAAVAPLEEAARLAAQAGDDRLAAAAAVELVGAMADGGMAPSAIVSAPLAEALVVRAGNRPEQRGGLRLWQGAALIQAERNPEGVTALSEARALLTQSLGARDPLALNAGLRLYNALWQTADYHRRDTLGRELLATELEVLGPDHPQTGVLLGRLGLAATRAGDFATAHELIDRNLAIQTRAYGETSLPAAVAINLRGVLEESEDHLDAAAQDYEHVLAIRRQLLAADHPLVAHALANLAGARRLQHRYAEALADVATALAIMRRTYGEAHSDVAWEMGVRADILADQGELQQARETYQQALAIWNRIKGPQHLDTVEAMVSLAQLDARMGRCEEVRRLVVPAQATVEAVHGKSHSMVAKALAMVARCDLDEQGTTELAPLEQALRSVDKPEVPPGDRGEVRFELARALWATGARARARALARQGESELVQSGPFGARDLERARAWLRTH